MRLRLCVFSFAAMSGAYFPTLPAGQVIAAGPTYVCNGERLHLESFDIRDLSDSSQCMVAHLDKMRPNGFPTYKQTTQSRSLMAP